MFATDYPVIVGCWRRPCLRFKTLQFHVRKLVMWAYSHSGLEKPKFLNVVGFLGGHRITTQVDEEVERPTHPSPCHVVLESHIHTIAYAN